MPTSSFTSKRIRVSFTLASGFFGASTDQSNTKVIEGLRVICSVKKLGEPSKNECRLQIFGMLPSDMTQLSTLGFTGLGVRKNLILVEAGDSDGLATVFQGEITGAWVNYHRPPDLYFEVHAAAGYYPAVAPANPRSAPGAVAVAGLFQSLAADMGYAFMNNGVNATVSNPYLTGSAYSQAQQLARAANIDFGIDDGQLFICPKGQYRTGYAAFTSPTTGMKDYPVFNKKGMEVEMLFNPAVVLGGQLQVSGSAVTQANGFWRIYGLEHHLVSRHPTSSSWHTRAHLSIPGALG